MIRSEWLNELEEALVQELPSAFVRENIEYYASYINDEMRTKTEEDVLNGLGEPRLIAHTIIDTYKLKNHGELDRDRIYYSDQDDTQRYEEDVVNDYEREFGRKNKKERHSFTIHQIKWYHKVLFFGVLFAFLWVLFYVSTAILGLVIKYGLPFLLLYLVYRFIKNHIS